MKTTKQASATFMPWNYDTRVIARNLSEGVITAPDHKAFLAALPDVASKADSIHSGRPGEQDLDSDLDDESDEQE